MQSTILNALDDLTSTRSTWDIQDSALLSLEQIIASVLLSQREDSGIRKEELLQLQNLFEYNIPIRLISWLSCHLNDVNGKKSRHSESIRTELTSLFIRALELLQGLALLHAPSKQYLGRRSSLEVLLDILSVARQSSKPLATSTNSSSDESCISGATAALALAVLDTFLCILVDSPPAIRMFEKSKGLEATVKLLRRSSIPKEVRMKCLEVLYLYLMDETSGKRPELAMSATPHSSEISLSKSAKANTSSMLSGSTSSSTLSPTPTLITSPSTLTPPSSPTKYKKRPEPLCRSYNMLRKDVDYVPSSPSKPRATEASVDGLPPLGLHRGTLTKEMYGYGLPNDVSDKNKLGTTDRVLGDEVNCLRSTEEKKELLGRLLGNVDALVEGVKNAGIWDLAS